MNAYQEGRVTRLTRNHKTYGTGGYSGSGSETLLWVGVELKATTTVYKSRKIPIRCGAGPDRIPLRGTRTGVQRVGEFDATEERGRPVNPYQQGRGARLLGKQVSENPYFLDSASWKRWRQGWMDSDKEFAK